MNSILAQPAERTISPPGDRRPWRDAVARHPLASTVILAFAGTLLLQCWRRYFFLTDDAIADWLPSAVEAYRRLWEGRWPFYNAYVFGGVSLLGDSGVFSLLSPYALACSFLAKTPYYYLIPDVIGTCSLVTVAAAFCWSALRLRERWQLPIPTAWIVAASLSYAFTPYNFIVDASWVGFANAPAALPVIFAAAFEPRWRRALALTTGALLYAMFGGHMHPFTVLVLAASLLVAGVAAVQRRWQPLLIWGGAGLLAFAVTAPLLLPALAGFGHDTRSAGVPIEQASVQNVALVPLLKSFFLGPISQALQDGIVVDRSDPMFGLCIAFAFVNLPLAAALAFHRRWRGAECVLLAGVLCAVVSIVRPPWLGMIFAHLPLLRSLRWPFREIAILHFCSHTLFVFVYRSWPSGARRMAAFAGAGVGGLAYALVFLCVAPTFWLFEPDRRLLASGEADRYWNEVKANGWLRPDASFVVEADRAMFTHWRPAVPFTVLGGFDHPSEFRVHTLFGFSAAMPPPAALALAKRARAAPYFWGAIFTHEAAMKLVAARPGTVRIVLTGMAPTRWEIDDGDAVHRFVLGPDWHIYPESAGENLR